MFLSLTIVNPIPSSPICWFGVTSAVPGALSILLFFALIAKSGLVAMIIYFFIGESSVSSAFLSSDNLNFEFSPYSFSVETKAVLLPFY